MNRHWEQIEQIFTELDALPVSQRAEYVRRVTAGKPELREELQSLLEAEASFPEDFLQVGPSLARELQRTITGQFLEGRSLGRYRLLQLLHDGSMGMVFQGIDEESQTPIAVKLLPPEQWSKPGAYGQIRKEAAALEAISHPAVVQLLDCGEHRGFYFLVMEFVAGRTLRQVLTERSAINREGLARQLISALCAIHRAGLVHGDLKPENLMVTPDGQLRVIDFGLAAQTGHNPIRDTANLVALAGTLAYSAPERIRGERPSLKSDIFAAGCIIHELLAGEALFSEQSVWETAEKILHHRATLSAALPAAWKSVVRRCVERNPKKRFGDAAAILDALSHGRGLATRSIVIAVAAFGLLLASVSIEFRREHAALQKHAFILGERVYPDMTASAEGRFIAFARRDRADQRVAHIELADAGSGEIRTLTSGNYRDRYPSLDSAASMVYFESNRRPAGIYRLRLKTRGRTPEIFIPGGHIPRLSPDGKWIVYYRSDLPTSDSSTQGGTGVILASTAQPSRMIWSEDYIKPLSPASWKSDGTELLVFGGRINLGSAAFVLGAATGTPIATLRDQSVCGWNEGRQIVGIDITRRKVGLLALESQIIPSPRLLASHGFIGNCFSAGNTLWGVEPNENSRLLSIPINGGAPQEIHTGAWIAPQHPSQSQDGRLLTFLADRRSNPGIRDQVLLDRSTGHFRAVRDCQGTGMLSPDKSALLAYPESDTYANQQLLIPATLKLRHEDRYMQGIVWHLSQRGELQLSATPESPRGILVSRADTEKVLYTIADSNLNLYLPDLSADERWIVFVAERLDGSDMRVVIAPFYRDHAAPRSEWIDAGQGDFPRWSITGDRIFYLDASGAVSHIMSLALNYETKRPAGAPSIFATLSGAWTPNDLPSGTFRMTVSRKDVVFSVARTNTVVFR